MSITPTGDGVAGLSVTAQAGTAGEAAEVANDAAAIVVELFNAVPTVPAEVVCKGRYRRTCTLTDPLRKLSTGRGT